MLHHLQDQHRTLHLVWTQPQKVECGHQDPSMLQCSSNMPIVFQVMLSQGRGIANILHCIILNNDMCQANKNPRILYLLLDANISIYCEILYFFFNIYNKYLLILTNLDIVSAMSWSIIFAKVVVLQISTVHSLVRCS